MTTISTDTTMTAPARTTMADAMLPLIVWLSPAFPTGAFAYSHGLEWAVEAGDVHDAASLQAWLDDLILYGAFAADAVLLAAAYGAAPGDRLGVNELALALCGARERRLETSAQGNAFLIAVRAAWPAAQLEAFAGALGDDDVAYPVAVAVAAAAHGLALRPTLEAFVLAGVGNLVSAVLRLGPIGQSEAQAIIARLCPAVVELAAFAQSASLDDLGAASWRSDIAAMSHEMQYSRLFRS